jgi:predicted small secreted protein
MKITRALIPAALLCAALAACTSDSPAGIEPGQASENNGITLGSGNRGVGQDTSSTTESGTASSEASGGMTFGSGN